MMAGIIFVCSVVFLLQFFVSYCRSLIAASGKQPLSLEVQDFTGIDATKPAKGRDFARVLQYLHMCPDNPDDRARVQAVGAYYHMLNVVRSTLARVTPSVRAWTEFEQAQCTYFAAVALERRIAVSRDMLAQQVDA
jgi:hypothetical protein